ncbi:LysR substrate-binding domain-containing protein [Burkholderia gladioli]|uniref:LysR substrate-binding domain-containing protein n=1 Tax=Burkholderia gladioli TaxID=28095 RepID=UPI001641D4D5|nr:LysR substrate-binding domain-containing protein [Burkholderia gladioli]
MLDLDDMRMIRALGAARSLAAAARLLDLTPPAVTSRLQRLEERLGLRLALREARGVTLTEEGRQLLQEAVELLERIESIPARLAGDSGQVGGKLRIVAPFGFGRAHVAPIVRDLHRDHPRLQISLQLADNPFAAAPEADVVVHIGQIRASSWIGHHLAPNERLLCASPELARRLVLSHPSELTRYPCLCLRENDEEQLRWRFTPDLPPRRGAPPAKPVTVRVSGLLGSNDGTVISDWAAAGLGIIERSEWDAAPLIAAGRLVRVLPGWRLAPAPVMALVPDRRQLTIRQRLFLEAARRALDPPPWRRSAGTAAQ